MREPIRPRYQDPEKKVCELCGASLQLDPEEGQYHCPVCEADEE
ncbi:hypothetical protein [Geobacter sp.]|nr:hypothetical protein [Geobacter sp.]